MLGCPLGWLADDFLGHHFGCWVNRISGWLEVYFLGQVVGLLAEIALGRVENLFVECFMLKWWGGLLGLSIGRFLDWRLGW